MGLFSKFVHVFRCGCQNSEITITCSDESFLPRKWLTSVNSTENMQLFRTRFLIRSTLKHFVLLIPSLFLFLNRRKKKQTNRQPLQKDEIKHTKKKERKNTMIAWEIKNSRAIALVLADTTLHKSMIWLKDCAIKLMPWPFWQMRFHSLKNDYIKHRYIMAANI